MARRLVLAFPLVALLFFASGILLGSVLRLHIVPEPEITTCFTPGEKCTDLIVNFIDTLCKQELLVQAYNFTSPSILEALARAKSERHVVVRIILDKTNEESRYTGGEKMEENHIP